MYRHTGELFRDLLGRGFKTSHVIGEEAEEEDEGGDRMEIG